MADCAFGSNPPRGLRWNFKADRRGRYASGGLACRCRSSTTLPLAPVMLEDQKRLAVLKVGRSSNLIEAELNARICFGGTETDAETFSWPTIRQFVPLQSVNVIVSSRIVSLSFDSFVTFPLKT